MRRNSHPISSQIPSNFALKPIWGKDWLNCALDLVWRAYDKLIQEYKNSGKDIKTEYENVITFSLLQHIDEIKGISPTHFSILRFYNQVPDNLKSNDIGIFFGSKKNGLVFILEAKPIKTLTEKGIGLNDDGTYKDKSYLKDLDALLNGYYKPLPESGLLAYLFVETAKEFFRLVERCCKEKLIKVTYFAKRPHRTSTHKRNLVNSTPTDFICHHLAMEMN